TLLNVPFALIGGGGGPYLAGVPMSGGAAGGFIAVVGQAAPHGGVGLAAGAGEPGRGGGGGAGGRGGGAQPGRRRRGEAGRGGTVGVVGGAMGGGIGSETQRPLAVVIVWGTLSACALTLVLLPVMYQVFARATAKVQPRLRAQRLRLVSALSR